MKLELQMDRDRFLPGEDIEVQLRLENTGSTELELPTLVNDANDQPVWSLTRPGQAQPETFSARSVAWKGPGPLPAAGPPAVRTVKAGGELSGIVHLRQWKTVEQPGAYTLQAKLDWNGASATSNALTFAVETGQYVAAGLGLDAAAGEGEPLAIVWLVQASGKRTLGQTLAFEKRPDLGEIKLSGAASLRALSVAAVEPFLPVANFRTSDDLWGWHGWREGRGLLALQLGTDKPQSFDLGSSAAALVRPALMAAPSGDLDQLVISERGNELRLVRFPFVKGEGAAPGKPELKWKLPLPWEVAAARAALGTVAQGSPRRVALVSQGASALVISEVDAGDGGKAGALRSVQVPGGHAVAHSEPGAAVDEQGATRVAVVFATGDASAGLKLSLAEAVFPGPGHKDPPSVSVSALASLEKSEKVAQAAATWRVHGTGPLQSRWLVLLEGGQALSSASPGQRLHFPPAAAAAPLELVQLKSAAYLLLIDPAAGPRLETVP